MCVASPTPTSSPQADSQVETMKLHFQEESLTYVCKLQEIQERKKFECVEPVSDITWRHVSNDVSHR